MLRVGPARVYLEWVYLEWGRHREQGSRPAVISSRLFHHGRRITEQIVDIEQIPLAASRLRIVALGA